MKNLSETQIGMDDYESIYVSRRRFLTSTAACLLTGPTILGAVRPAWARKLESDYGSIRVTEIEVHEIMLPYEDWISYQLNHYYGPSRRTIYVAHTNTGLIGLGESGGRESDDVIDKYVGTNPFNWIADETSLGLGTAMYDLMGKIVGVPVYKLFSSRRYRRWVPVGSWTVSTHPKRMAQAVTEYAARGYTWMKYHLSPFENVIDQMRAMQDVAPEGFKILFDLTMGGTNDPIPDLLEKISEFPIAGAFEDPLYEKDIDAYIELRRQSRLPIVLHHSSQGFTFDVLRRAGDAYIVGHAKIGNAMRLAGLFAQANAPFMLQNVGGSITRAMTTHMQAAFKTASFHFHSDDETWKADVVKDRLEPINGFIRVPDGPGLGVALDRAALEELKQLQLPPQAKWIIKTRFGSGATMYNIADPKESIFMVRPDVRRLIPMSYYAAVTTEYWDDDGSVEYQAMFARIEKEGVVLEGP